MSLMTCPGCGEEFDPLSGHENCPTLLPALKDALLKHGRELSKEEAIEFLQRPIWLGPPKLVARGKRGPQSKRNQYDLAVARRREPLRRLKKLPAQSGKAAKKAADKHHVKGKRIVTAIIDSSTKYLPYRRRVRGKARDFPDLVRLVAKATGHDPSTVRPILRAHLGLKIAVNS